MRAIALVAGSALVVTCIALAGSNYPYNHYQTAEQIKQEYLACKADAPRGFDCVVSVMLVSEDFLRQEYGYKAKSTK